MKWLFVFLMFIVLTILGVFITLWFKNKDTKEDEYDAQDFTILEEKREDTI